MDVTLINLPNPALAEPWSNFPLGLGYVAAALEKRKLAVKIVDMCEDINFDNIEVSNVFGLSVTAPQVTHAKYIAQRLRLLFPKSLIVAGGPQTLVDRNTFLSEGIFDAVVIEEGEFSFYELIRHHELYKQVEQVYWNPPIKLLDDIPFPARHLFPAFKENALKTKQLLKGDYIDGGQTTMIASRGCPYKCSFCAPHPRQVRFRSPENVIAELRDIIDKHEIYQFKWQDDTFTLSAKWVLQLCDLIKRQLPKTYHRAHTRVNVFNDEIAEAMFDAGFRILCFGIESFSQRLLDINQKGTTVDQIENALRIAKRHKFKTVGFLIYGMPGENRQSVDETQNGILRNKPYLDFLNLATMVPLMGTPVYQNPDKYDCTIVDRNFDKYWIVDHETSDVVLLKSNDVSLKDAQEMKKEMYQFLADEGYSRPEWKS